MTMQNQLNNHLCADQPFPKHSNYNKELDLCLEHTEKFHCYLDPSIEDKKIRVVP